MARNTNYAVSPQKLSFVKYVWRVHLRRQSDQVNQHWEPTPSSSVTSEITGSFPEGATTAVRATMVWSGYDRFGITTNQPSALMGPHWAGRHFVASAWVRASFAAEVRYARAYFTEQISTGIRALYENTPQQVIDPNEWVLVTTPYYGPDVETPTFQAPLDALGVGFGVYLDPLSGEVPVGATLDITNVMINEVYPDEDEGPPYEILPFFSGDTETDANWAYGWDGTENLSHSVRVPNESGVSVFPRPSEGSIQLRIQTPGEVLSIYRYDENGYNPVRVRAGHLPADGLSGLVVVTDYEPALRGSVRYDVNFDWGSHTTPLVSLEASSSWLSLPSQPNVSVPLSMVLGVDVSREAATTVHPVIGGVNPLVTVGPLQSRRGMWSTVVSGYQTAREIERLYSRQQVALLRQQDHPELDLFHVPLSVRVSPSPAGGARTFWLVEVEFVEVARPTGPLLGALGWTYEDVATDYADYLALVSAFQDYVELQIGPSS